MKKLSLFLVTLMIATGLRAAAPELVSVPVEFGLKKFADGDSIVVREVLATSPRMDVGDTVIVRGHYVLQSQTRASIGLSLTKIEDAKPTRISPAANSLADQGEGDFEVTFEVKDVGCLHLTFNRLPDRKSFGTIYFGTPEQLERVRNMRW